MTMSALLQIKNLDIELRTQKSAYKVVEDINIEIGRKQTYGIVGESGCGKSLTAMSIMGLLSNPPLRVGRGEMIFDGRCDLLKLTGEEMRKIRGKEISMIFQEPMTALDPLFNIESQIVEVLRFHSNLSENEMKETALEMLKKVGIPRAESIMKEYPHQLSGGMLQRIMIATALICNPKLLIADEPTTALDVTIQAQILDLMNELKNSYDTSVIMITHDLGVIAETCDRVAVFYGGQVVEEADVVTLFHNTAHPYTFGLLRAVTSLGDKNKGLYSIPGVVPSADKMPNGCRFAERCDKRLDICMDTAPKLIEIEEGHKCRCWLHERGYLNG